MARRTPVPAAPPADEIKDFADKLRRALEEGWQFYAVPEAEREALRPGARRQIDAIEAALRAEHAARAGGTHARRR
ncbi:MAG: hypothetical protein H0X67_08185 [Acidobacteria bacterium]|nr:hypothetical protein [Acidobacteriota bacterium]